MTGNIHAGEFYADDRGIVVEVTSVRDETVHGEVVEAPDAYADWVGNDHIQSLYRFRDDFDKPKRKEEVRQE